MKTVELFAGAGGLALGVSRAGFEHLAVVERDQDCCRTIKANQEKKVKSVVEWPLHELDVRKFDFSQIKEKVDLLAAGPPCQPFSIGGKHKGIDDERNMFPEVATGLRILKPSAFIIENVRGILRPSFKQSLEYILLMLRYPELQSKQGEKWSDHNSRLLAHHRNGKQRGLSYSLGFQFLNATDFGVAQRRERVFIVGFRSELEVDWRFPTPTHSSDSLLRSMWVTGEYWDRHSIAKKYRLEEPPHLRGCLDRIRSWSTASSDLPWQTVRDALAGLPDPSKCDHSKKFPNHWLNIGARSYPGHTGSRLDEPAKVLKAGAHGVPGGENMLAYPDGSVRYFTVRECARLQSFPDDYVFEGAWTRCMRQIGNAVPVHLAEAVAKAVHTKCKLFQHSTTEAADASSSRK